MRHNRTKEILKNGGAAFGITVGPNDADLVEMAGLLGFDFAIVDCEHDLFDESALTQVLRAADLHGMTAIARMQNNPELLLHALDGGAQGVLVARVNTAADAQFVHSCRVRELIHLQKRRKTHHIFQEQGWGLRTRDRVARTMDSGYER